jgi:hypothetical protein
MLGYKSIKICIKGNSYHPLYILREAQENNPRFYPPFVFLFSFPGVFCAFLIKRKKMKK